MSKTFYIVGIDPEDALDRLDFWTDRATAIKEGMVTSEDILYEVVITEVKFNE